MGIEIFGIEFGGDSKEDRRASTKEYIISQREVLEALNLEGKCCFMAYDYKTKKLTIKIKEE